MERLILFDIDKTLIKLSGAHFTAFSEAFRKVYGVSASIDSIRHDGMTDQQIIIEVLKKEGLDEQAIRSKMEDCMRVIASSFNEAVDLGQIYVLDGVRELLEELDKDDMLLGLVTGNLEEIARAKLRKAGLNRYFKVGGFGNDDINRAKLVKKAVQRAEKHFDFHFDENVFLFGDTPQDMRAGKMAGASTIGVTTGIFTEEQLENAGADCVLEDLKDTDRILRILLS